MNQMNALSYSRNLMETTFGAFVQFQLLELKDLFYMIMSVIFRDFQ